MCAFEYPAGSASRLAKAVRRLRSSASRSPGLPGIPAPAQRGRPLKAAPGAGGVVVIPYFEGERTPNLPDATATFHGLSFASASGANVARVAVEGMLCGLVEGLDAVCSAGVETRRVILIGGAVQNAAVQTIAAQVFNIPVVAPAPGEYVARGAVFQAAWGLSGTVPHWAMNAVAIPEPDFRCLIREQYWAVCALTTTTKSAST
jgi:xylulokinase